MLLKNLYKRKMKVEDDIYYILKDIKLYPNDLVNNLLSNVFFERIDIDELLKEKLLTYTEELKNINNEIFKTS